MEQINIKADFSKITGRIKPMHSVNNGPAGNRGTGNFDGYSDASFPFARTHDASFCPSYGGSHTVDIIAIFPDFDADENDPSSYDFDLTDEYMEHIMETGTKVFYRLGNKIEHESKRYGAIPPKDYAKWARICEHIIRHMNEGWANGHSYGIEYWEIWNEPDLHPQCWDGKDEDFYPLYDIAARHLKKCFPDLHIGGPAVTGVWNERFIKGFFDYITRDKSDPAPLDFFSFHCYSRTPGTYYANSVKARKICDSYGYNDAELILNEWNYVKNWTPAEDILYSYYVIPSLKGSAFVCGSVLEAQRSPLDHFMYYDARANTNWNGLFDHYTYRQTKPCLALKAFSYLYENGKGMEAYSESDSQSVPVCAAVSADGNTAYVLASYYLDEESIDSKGTEEKTISLRIDWSGFSSGCGVKAEYMLIDAEHNLDTVSEETFLGVSCAHILSFPLYSTVLVKLTKI